MNARLSLLVLVVITFMAIWDADRQSKAVIPPRTPQPLSWNLPLPVSPNAVVMEPTPIVVPETSGVLVTSEAATAPVTVVEDPICEEAVAVAHTFVDGNESAENPVVERQSVEHGSNPFVSESTIPATDDGVVAPAGPFLETETVEVSESEAAVAASVVAAETADVTKTDEGTSEVAAETVAESVKVSEAVIDALPPENLQTSDHWGMDRLLQLSRNARASHEQTTSPISPELYVENSSKTEFVTVATESSSEANEVAEQSPIAVDQQTTGAETSEKTEEPLGELMPEVEYLPVPKNLASGTWQLISQDGEMLQITITRQEEPASEVELSDKYATGIDPKGKRWGFVRLPKSAPEAGKVTDVPSTVPESDAVARPVQKAATEFFSPSTR